MLLKLYLALAAVQVFNPSLSDPLIGLMGWYNDFIFANNSTTDGTGLSILIERIAPNTKYGLTIWSFDPQSAGARVSDWFEIASGITRLLRVVVNRKVYGSPRGTMIFPSRMPSTSR